MKTRKRTQFILLLVTLGLLVSMIISFTPQFGALFGRNSGSGPNGQAASPTALLVNGQSISDLQVARARSTPPFQTNFEGEVGEDLNTLLVDNLIQTELIRQASLSEKVSGAEVKEAVNNWRDSQGVGGRKNDGNYVKLISRFGYDDASFRDVFREQLRMDKYRNNLTDNVTVSDEEVQAFYDINADRYQSSERILAREIVLDNREAAEEVLASLENGADFATLAKEKSIERADRAGALGAAKDTTEPKPVGRAALPSAVSAAVFDKQNEGLSGIIEANDKFYIVNVEKYIPSGIQDLDEVREQVKSDALEAKKAGVFETTMADLRSKAKVEIPADSSISYDNSVVAKVNDTEIRRAELARAVYNNPQIAQALRPDTTQIITSLFKPSILESLIDRELAYQGAKKLGAKFFGSKDNIALSALNYVSKDVTASDEEIAEYYNANLARYTIPAKAVAYRVNFDNQEAAKTFRERVLAGEEPKTVMEDLGGTQVDLGTVNPGELPSELDTILFKTSAFVALPNSKEEMSDVLVLTEDTPTEDGATENITSDEANANDENSSDDAKTEEANTTPKTKEVFVVLIADRTPEVIRPLTEVKAQVKNAVLAQKKQDKQKEWLKELRDTGTVESFLKSEDLVPTPAVSTDDKPVFETTPLPAEESTPENDNN